MRCADGFIAVDWGTTNRRAYRVDSSGKCVDEFEDSKGVLTLAADDFPAAVAEIRERLGDLPMFLAGMIGSNRGWVEAPYVACPAGIDDLAGKVVWADERAAIVPGVSYLGTDRADVMRGEEVQLLGGIAAGKVPPDGLLCHPGTHNKWVSVASGRIASFRTVMTGELFNLLKQHSVLSDLLTGEVTPNDAFRAGVRHGLEQDDLTADLFAIRARVLLGASARDDAPPYASGLLIGADVRVGLEGRTDQRIAVMGRPDLCALYSAALAEAGSEAIELDGEQCFLAGIQEIAKRI